jgi:hypothetical protein
MVLVLVSVDEDDDMVVIFLAAVEREEEEEVVLTDCGVSTKRVALDFVWFAGRDVRRSECTTFLRQNLLTFFLFLDIPHDRVAPSPLCIIDDVVKTLSHNGKRQTCCLKMCRWFENQYSD